MTPLFKKLLTPAAQESALYYFGSLILSFGRYLFHLVLLRLLLPASYGEFLSYVSLLYLLTIPSSIIQLIVNRTVAAYYGKKDLSKINAFFYYILKRGLAVGLVIAVVIIFLTQPLTHLLKANPTAFLVLAVMTIFSILGSIIRSYLPALHQFIFQVVIGFFEVITLIGSVFLFTSLGLDAISGVLAMLVSSIIGLLITLYRLRRYLFPPHSALLKPDLGHIFTHSLIFSIGTLSMFSLDVLLVRHFFTATDSGLYSALVVIGRMIYFGLTPLAALILPIATTKHTQGKSTTNVFIKLLVATFVLGGGATLIFTIFPQLVVKLLSGSQYLSITPLIPYIAVSMLLQATNFLTLSYFIAIQKNSSTYILAFFALAQPVLIYLNHTSLYQVVSLNLTLQLCLFISLLIYHKITHNYVPPKSRS